MSITMIKKDELLAHWLGHRTLTRKTIEKFPEKELFEFSIGGMRPFSELVKEFLAITASLGQVVNDEASTYNHDASLTTKQALLEQWDSLTPQIIEYFEKLTESRLHQKVKLFGEYENTAINHILYFIDNEVHHRAQGFVYLRALGIEPPFFWERF